MYSFAVIALGGIVFAVLEASVFRILVLFGLVGLCIQVTLHVLDISKVVVAKCLAVLALID